MTTAKSQRTKFQNLNFLPKYELLFEISVIVSLKFLCFLMFVL